MVPQQVVHDDSRMIVSPSEWDALTAAGMVDARGRLVLQPDLRPQTPQMNRAQRRAAKRKHKGAA